MCPLVLAEMGVQGEGSATLGAGVRLLPAVRPCMLPQLRLLSEGLPTLLTREGLLPSVHALVDGEARALAEGLPTSRAHVWLLPSVDPLVPEQLGALGKGLAADSTHVCFLPAVDVPPVLGEAGAPVKRLPALVALHWPLPSVRPLVPGQVAPVREDSVTMVAGPSPLAEVL